MPTLRIAVIGAGAFGRNHLRVYGELASAGHEVQLAAVVDPSEQHRHEAASRYEVPAFASVQDLLASGPAVDAASICVPTVHHAAIAKQLLATGIDVLIEKPFASTLAEADEVLAAAREQGRIVQVGHLERFNPAVTAVAPLINRPMFFESHRLSIFTPRSLDVDVVLDLMIHDLDIVLQLAASPVRELRAVGLPVLSRKVDIANVRVEFESGCVANFTASRVSTEQVRKLRFFQPQQYLSLDFAKRELLTIQIDPRIAALVATMPQEQLIALAKAARSQAAGDSSAHPSPGLEFSKPPVQDGEPLRLEIEDFLHAVRTRQQPRVPGEQGRAALALALEINAAIADHAKRAGLTS